MSPDPAGRALIDPVYQARSKRLTTRGLVMLAMLVAVVGALYLTPATLGVGLIAAGCFLGILARLHQAS